MRIAITLLGVLFALQGLVWLVAPERAAAGLDMPLLDGAARSTQIGDFAAFFLVAGTTMLLGARPGRAPLLGVSAALFGCAAVGRLVAWALHGADLAALFILVEVAMTTLLLVATRRP